MLVAIWLPKVVRTLRTALLAAETTASLLMVGVAVGGWGGVSVAVLIFIGVGVLVGVEGVAVGGLTIFVLIGGVVGGSSPSKKTRPVIQTRPTIIGRTAKMI